MQRNRRKTKWGIIDRFTTIMKSNINALLDKAEDPAKMVDQTLYELHEDLAEVRTNTAKVMAEEKRVKKQQLEDCDADYRKIRVCCQERPGCRQ